MGHHHIMMLPIMILHHLRSAPLLLTLELAQLAWQCRYRFFNAPGSQVWKGVHRAALNVDFVGN